jgi:hypothetical protein
MTKIIPSNKLSCQRENAMLFPSNSVQYKFLPVNVIQGHMKKSTNLILLYNVHQDKEPVYRNSERKNSLLKKKCF